MEAAALAASSGTGRRRHKPHTSRQQRTSRLAMPLRTPVCALSSSRNALCTCMGVAVGSCGRRCPRPGMHGQRRPHQLTCFVTSKQGSHLRGCRLCAGRVGHHLRWRASERWAPVRAVTMSSCPLSSSVLPAPQTSPPTHLAHALRVQLVTGARGDESSGRGELVGGARHALRHLHRRGVGHRLGSGLSCAAAGGWGGRRPLAASIAETSGAAGASGGGGGGAGAGARAGGRRSIPHVYACGWAVLRARLWTHWRLRPRAGG